MNSRGPCGDDVNTLPLLSTNINYWRAEPSLGQQSWVFSFFIDAVSACALRRDALVTEPRSDVQRDPVLIYTSTGPSVLLYSEHVTVVNMKLILIMYHLKSSVI